jgi:NAD-dependent SIR2 family protein deacetylase
MKLSLYNFEGTVYVMTYRCRGCFSTYEEEEVSDNWSGDPQCPQCGSFDFEEVDDPEIYGEDDEDNEPTSSFYGEDGTMDS